MTRFAKNILYNLLGQGLVVFVSFLAVKYVFTHLGKDARGIIFFTQTLSIVSRSVLELGIAARSNLFAPFIILPVTFLLVRAYEIDAPAFSWVFYHVFTYSYRASQTCQECLGMPTLRWCHFPLQCITLVILTHGGPWHLLGRLGTRPTGALGGPFCWHRFSIWG
jgi:hypothetical protein